MRLESQTIGSLDELERIGPAWRALWRRARAATPFQSPDWLIAWWRHFAPGQLMSIALRRGEYLVGLAPLYREARDRRLLPLGVSLSDCLDILIAEENANIALSAMQKELARIPLCRELCFPELAPNASALCIALDGFASVETAAQASPELVLGPPDDPLRHVPAHQRQNLRTAENRARRRGCVVSGVGAEELPHFIPGLMHLHSARRRHVGEEGLGSDRRVLPFFGEAFVALAREGVVRAYSIRCEGRLIGGYLGFMHRDRASYYFGGFDPGFAFESPGTILIGHAIRGAAAEGAETFDFLRGAEPYKYAWGARDRRLKSLSFVRRFPDVELAS